MLRNIDLNLLKVFDAVMREQSINRAAKRLNVTQPAISNSLRKLRDLYNDELFIRSAKGVIPTPRAYEIGFSVRKALENVSNTLETDEEFRPEKSHRKFTISLSDYGEVYFLPQIMQKIMTIAPNVDVICLPEMSTSLMLEMKSGQVDLVWDWKRIDDADYYCEKIFEDKSCMVAREDHPEIEAPVDLELFLKLNHVVIQPTRTRMPRIERILESRGLERKVVSEVSHVQTVPAVVASTNLVGCIPERLAQFYARQLSLSVYPNPVFEDPVACFQMWHRHLDDDPGHQWFRKLLAEVAKSA